MDLRSELECDLRSIRTAGIQLELAKMGAARRCWAAIKAVFPNAVFVRRGD